MRATQEQAEALVPILSALRSGEGPSRLLDGDLSRALGVVPAETGADGRGGFGYLDGGQWASVHVDTISTSTDAALLLADHLFAGCWYILGKGRTSPDEPLFGAQLYEANHDPRRLEGEIGQGEHAANQACAILIALIDAWTRP